MSWLSSFVRHNKNTLTKAVGVVAAATGVGAVATAAIVGGSKALLSATTKPKTTATPANSATQAVQTSAASPASPSGALSGNASMIAILLVGGMILFLMVGVKR